METNLLNRILIFLCRNFEQFSLELQLFSSTSASFENYTSGFFLKMAGELSKDQKRIQHLQVIALHKHELPLALEINTCQRKDTPAEHVIWEQILEEVKHNDLYCEPNTNMASATDFKKRNWSRWRNSAKSQYDAAQRSKGCKLNLYQQFIVKHIWDKPLPVVQDVKLKDKEASASKASTSAATKTTEDSHESMDVCTGNDDMDDSVNEDSLFSGSTSPTSQAGSSEELYVGNARVRLEKTKILAISFDPAHNNKDNEEESIQILEAKMKILEVQAQHLQQQLKMQDQLLQLQQQQQQLQQQQQTMLIQQQQLHWLQQGNYIQQQWSTVSPEGTGQQSVIVIDIPPRKDST